MELNTLLKGEQLLPCTLLHEGRHLAWLDPSARQSQPLEEASQLQLPLWLVEPLPKRRHVDLEMPKFYGNAYRNAMRADAAHLNLGCQSDFYFEVGAQLAQLVDDSGDLGGQLLAGFAHRFHGLLDASLNVTTKTDSRAMTEKLTLREKQLFDAGRDAAAQYNTWKAAKTRGRIEQAAIVQHQASARKKRARA